MAKSRLDIMLDHEEKKRYSTWHPGRLRRGVPIIGKSISPERRTAVRQYLRPLMDENKEISKMEREELESKYMQLWVVGYFE